MKRLSFGLVAQILLMFFVIGMFPSCGNHPESFPSLMTDFVTVQTDVQGRATLLTTDENKTYQVENSISGLSPSSLYRLKADFLIDGNTVQIWQAQNVTILHDSTAVAVHDSLHVQSAWIKGEFINVWLQPRTGGGEHHYGFALDSIFPHHLFLSLHHRQGTDPTSYSTDTYASLPLKELPFMAENDTVTLIIYTFEGKKSWNLSR